MSTPPRLDLFDLEDHELIAVDRNGEHCACGVVAVFLEHYAAVGLTALDAPGARDERNGTIVTAEHDIAIRALLITPTVHGARRLLSSATTSAVQRALRRRLTAAGLERLHTTGAAAARLTDRRTAQDAAIRRLHATGLNDRQIAHQLGISRRTIGSRRTALGLAPNYVAGREVAA